MRTSRLTTPAILALLLLTAALAPGCGRKPGSRQASAAPTDAEFSVMSYNLGRYSLADRDGDGQKNDPKPASEREALIRIIASTQPDILTVQEIGSPSVFEEFRYALRVAGLDYEHTEYLQRGQSEINMAVLSRFPIVSRQPHTDDTYTIGEAKIPVLRGFLDVEIEVNPDYTIRLIGAHLKSKVFHALGQTEMRRNEARLLNKHVRRILKDSPDENLLVIGDLNDTYESAPLREIMGGRETGLNDLRPGDAAGAVWTHFSSGIDQYERIDYALVSRGLQPEVVSSKTHVLSDPQTYEASDHRPLIIVINGRDTTSATVPAVHPQSPQRAEETD